MSALTLAAALMVAEPAAPAPLAELNHLALVLNQDQAGAIAASGEVDTFAELTVSTAVTGEGRSWTGRYLLGRQTYIEVFGPEDLSEESVYPGTIGLALSGDEVGAIDAIQNRLAAAGHEPVRSTVNHRTDDGGEIAWFERLTVEGMDDSDLRVWLMEYSPEYMAERPEPPEHPGDVISRERYNSDAYLDHQMRDVTAFCARVARADFERALPLFEAAGLRANVTAGGALITGDETHLNFTFAPRPALGPESVEFELNPGSSEPGRLKVGRSVIEVRDDDTAIWRFEPIQRD